MGYCALSPPVGARLNHKGLLMKVLLIIIICLLAVGLIALVYALKALTRREPSAASPDTQDDEEATLQDMVRILEKLEKRVDVLETLLDRHAPPRSGSDTGTSSRDETLR